MGIWTKTFVSAALLIGLTLPAAQAATLTVGPGKTYATIPAAVAAAGAGDIVEVYPGTYSGAACVAVINKNLTIRGIGTRPVLDATGYTIPNGKAIFVTQGADITVENLEFKGASVPSLNGAGIRPEGTKLTVRFCYFHDNENGIQGGAVGSEILIEYCEFNYNGYGDGQSHNVYINVIDKVTFRYNYSHRQRKGTDVGHLFKSRAQSNYILYNFFADEDTDASYEIDLPQGGLSYIIGNAIEQGVNANQGIIVTYAEENRNNTNQEVYIVNNTIVNDRSGGTFVNLVGPPTKALIMNNVFVGAGTILNGTGTLSNNVTLSAAQLVNTAAFDYHLIPFSTAIDKGINPGSTNGVNLWPAYEYVVSCTNRVRAVEAALDQGAFECMDANGDGIEDNWQRAFFGTLANTNGAPAADPDHDGVTNLKEYLGGTDPCNTVSRLEILGMSLTNSTLYLNWFGGTSVWQWVETKQDMSNTGEQWKAVYTSAPAAQITNTISLDSFTNQNLFLRIRALRP